MNITDKNDFKTELSIWEIDEIYSLEHSTFGSLIPIFEIDEEIWQLKTKIIKNFDVDWLL